MRSGDGTLLYRQLYGLKNRLRLAFASFTVVAATLATLTSSPVAFGGADFLVFDSFDGKGNAPLEGRQPDVSTTGSPWTVADGAWTVRGGHALDNTKVKEFFAGDRRAVTDTGSADMRVTAVMERTGGDELQGVVGRYVGPTDWVMAFYDGVGDIVLGAKESVLGGGFLEFGRVPVFLKNGKTFELSLELAGDSVSVFLDGEQILPVGGSEIRYGAHMDSTLAGIFLRGNGSSRFDEFSVVEP